MSFYRKWVKAQNIPVARYVRYKSISWAEPDPPLLVRNRGVRAGTEYVEHVKSAPRIDNPENLILEKLRGEQYICGDAKVKCSACGTDKPITICTHCLQILPRLTKNARKRLLKSLSETQAETVKMVLYRQEEGRYSGGCS